MDILLVEDNEAEARLTREALLDTGVQHQLFVAPDGEAATRFLKNEGEYRDVSKPNIVLLDLNLPRKHGLEVLAEMKADIELCRIPVIVLSNSQASEDIDDVYQLLGNCYLVKSGDLNEFFATIKSMVEFWMRRAKLPTVSHATVSPPPAP